MNPAVDNNENEPHPGAIATVTTENGSHWEHIYSHNKPGSFLSYPNENLVTLFFQNRKEINQSGTCLDFGLGSGNNAEFLIQHMGTLYGMDIAESSIAIARQRLARHPQFQPERFSVGTSQQLPTEGYFDLIVAWQMLYYNDVAGLHDSIERLYRALTPGGVLIATLITDRDVKVQHATPSAPGTWVIDGRIPHQQGCTIVSPANREDFSGLFHAFTLIDYGYYERASFMTNNTASEYYIIAKKT